jgi:hypothetical protein
MANTTWSTTDKSASITLSGGNLVATSTVVASGVRAVDLQRSGKYYFELTLTSGGNSQAIHGLANINAVLNTVGGTPTNAVGVLSNTGAIYLNGNSTGISFGARANGDVICIAADLDNGLVWFRIGAAGNWNANAAYAPGGSGGISLASIANSLIGLRPIYANASSANGSDTANFGDTAFTGSVPAGYTSGWPTSALALNAVVTTAAIEQWADGNPAARLTSVAVEQWATPTGIGVQAWLSQVAIEQWASASAAVVTATQPQVSVIT